ncbi:MAG: hypothetical protein AAFP19_03955 [Bacteroidota bacterium]
MSTSIRKLLTLFFVLSIPSLGLHAQVPANPIGLNPSHLRWRQINTDKVRVVFPEGMDAQGQRVANMIHYLWERDNASIGNRHHKVSIFLQNQTIIPNGFVTVGPFRSEFYMTPPQFNCTTDWLDLLAIHEYRHVQQFNNSRQGITQLARYVFGSWGFGGFMATALPRWFFEGDAVGMETALTRSGRGRLPSFEMEYRSLVLDMVNYSYEKAAAGSFKDFVPDWYALGYYMNSYVRRRHGKEIWANVLSDAVRYRGLFFPLSRSLKKRTGLATPDLYRAVRQELDSVWLQDTPEDQWVNSTIFHQKEKPTVTHYTNPHYLNEDQIIVEKRAFDQWQGYYLIDRSGKERRLTQPGVLLSPPNTTLSLGGSKLCWAEFGFDPRWDNRQYSIIKTYDLNTGKKQKITSRSRYFSPDISADGQKIITVYISEEQICELRVLDANTGYIIRKFANPDNWLYSFPRWNEDQSQVVVLAQKGESNHLQVIDFNSGDIQVLVPSTNAQITHPYAKGDTVYFAAAYSGINNIYATKIGQATIYQVSNDGLGAFQPTVSADGQRLLYSSFSRMGYDVREQEIKPQNWKVYQVFESQPDYFYRHLVEQEGGSITAQVPNERFKQSRFRKISGLIYPHSWLPFIEPPIAGAQILSDNKFSTLSSSLTTYYNFNDQDWTFQGDLSFAEFYPIANLGYRRIERGGNFFNFQIDQDSLWFQNFYADFWTENRFSGGLELPLNLSAGRFFNSVRLQADVQRRSIDLTGNFNSPNNFRDTFNLAGQEEFSRFESTVRSPIQSGDLNNVDLQVTLLSVQRRAFQNLYPRWGIRLYGRYRRLFNSPLESDVLLGRGDVFLPGLKNNHGLRFTFMHQEQDLLDNYRFSDFFTYPRGYGVALHEKVSKWGFRYGLPLAYPDVAITPLVFLKRIKADFFYDQARIQAGFPFAVDETLRSVGVDVTFDFRAFRLVEVDMGIRYTYLLDRNTAYGPANRSQNQFEFLLISITE